MRIAALSLALLAGISFQAAAQTTAQTPRRELPAKRTTAAFKIDGELNEAAWKEAQPATNFIEWRPTAGKPESPETGTEIYILYDNTAVYVAGFCKERTRDSVSRELVGRDVVGINDFVGVTFDTYNDKINAFGFYVTPYGEQFDARYSNTNGEDGSWNAVWNSASKIHANGWSFEMRIPFSMLRFVSKENQTWGLNITRRRNKTGQQFMWNPVDPQVNGFINQEGLWTGIEKIVAPLRLQFSPYLSAYANHFPTDEPNQKDWNTSINGGMDVKWGINDAFTLDMTLVPDFGQVVSDNTVLNLSPFEVQYQENRSFFTEGTELFNKGNLFYPRRIGIETPLHQYDARAYAENKGLTVIENPAQSKLVNATKISGRTRKGFGVGVFNAITQTMYATLENPQSKEREKYLTSPLTNYNVVVFDQTLKNNSSVSLINTNVLRNGSDYDANVTSAMFDFNNKKNTWNLNGNLSVSNLFHQGQTVTGMAHSLGFGKTGGRFNFNLYQERYDNKYDKSDLGFMWNNNYLDHSFWMGYKWVKPGKWFNQLRINYNATLSMRDKPFDYQSFFTNFNSNAQLKNLWWVGSFVGFSARGNDFYEARNGVTPFRTSRKINSYNWVETNGAKKYQISAEVGVNYFPDFKDSWAFDYRLSNRYRFSDKFSITHNFNLSPAHNNVGYYFGPQVGAGPTFSRRDRNTVEQILFFKYNFNNRSGVTLRARHYWSGFEVKELLVLQTDGSVKPMTADPATFYHQNFNLFNLDAVYTLQFAPGSFLNVVWKSMGNSYTDAGFERKYFRNIDATFDAPQNNNFSVKVIWFLDYLDLKRWKKNRAN
ncbi:DUF5916 domain-containing protein [Flaviaesturariibacter amylovorans]|uniref:Hydrolase n=1 Tax=Flaviaesturariibacter amylovorans TaxID=1084520 RepID=A0ABP8GLB8_9BACT